MRKFLKIFLIIIVIVGIFNQSCCFAAKSGDEQIEEMFGDKKDSDDTLNIGELIEKEEGSLFDKIIAKTIRWFSTSCL